VGEAQRKRALAQQLAGQRDALDAAVRQVTHALRRLAEAASANLGSDCYLHANLGRVLLADLGFPFEIRVGAAAWRLGSGDGDVVSHIPQRGGYLPPGMRGFAYHAWLEAGDLLVDMTTYQLRRKASDLDAQDGGHTTVDWCPDYLILKLSDGHTYEQVAKAPEAGGAYYESNRQLAALMADTSTLDADDVAAARLLLRHPDMNVVGPNMRA
jgi:hypothetical protein